MRLRVTGTTLTGCALAGGLVLAPAAPRAQLHDPATVSFASESWDATFFFPGGTYDPAVPTPEAVLGFSIGRRPARFDEVRRYLEALDAASTRVTLETHGRTHEGRDLLHAVIGREDRMSPEALAAIRERMARFADPRQGSGDAPAADLPLVAWLGYSIHGDEMSGCDAALQLAYQLAAGTDALTRSIRDSVLVFLDPNQNPDGRERYLAQMQSAGGREPNPDDQSLQHRGFWPWGRANHYLFDLNRDWFTLIHPESQGRVAALVAWHPQLVVDAHEMGWDDTYLFSPPREPFNPNLPAAAYRWWNTFAADQAAAFDRRGWSHYTREWNEEFFPGYGSSWGMYQGAIGILYEQAGTDGSVVRQPDGTYLTYREAVLHQFQSSLANLGTATSHRALVLRDYRASRRHAIAAGQRGGVRAFVYTPGSDPDRARRLTRTLQRQGIEVQQALEPLTVAGAHDFWGGEWKSKRVPAGSIVVPLDQPAGALVRNLMDFHVAMPDSFLREERDWLERDKGSRLYDVTTWSMPLAYNVETYWTAQTPRGRLGPVAADSLAQQPGRRPTYGYLIDGKSDAAMHAVAQLLENSYAVRVGLEEFQLGGHHYPRGTVLLRLNSNPESLHEFIWKAGNAAQVRIEPTDSGTTDHGPDLGGGRFPALEAPRIALVAGNPVSPSSYGALWHLLDHDLQIRVSTLDLQGMADLDLSKYSVIVLPDAFGSGSAYARALGPAGTKKLRAWVDAGGTLVAVGSGAEFAADSSQALSAVRLREDVLEKNAPALARLPLPESLRMDALGDVPRQAPAGGMPLLGPGALQFVQAVRPRGVRVQLHPRPAGKPGVTGGKDGNTAKSESSSPGKDQLERADERLRRFEPHGALVRVDVDQDDWLSVGVPERLPVMASSGLALIARDPVRVVGRFARADSLHLSGLLWPEAADRIARTACVTREAKGKGQVILFACDPTYRRATPATERLLLNAVLLGPGLGTSHPAPW